MDKNLIKNLVVAGTSLVIGGGGGYLIASKVLRKQYQDFADDQIAAVKVLYAKKYKEGNYESPEAMFTAVHPDTELDLNPVLPDSVREALEDYNGNVGATQDILPGFNELEDTLPAELVVTVLPSAEEIQDSIERNKTNIWDKVEEESKPMYPELVEETGGPERDPNGPYVITIAAFHLDDPRYAKISIVYYEGDNTLADDGGSVIPDIVGTVGINALTNFGKFSEDPNIVYVRNETLEVDWEIVRDPRTYAHAIAGFDVDSEEPARDPIRKMKGDDE